jgi:hypothetical protein
VSDQFSLPRFLHVLRNDASRVSRSVLVMSGTAALVVLLISLAGAYDGVVGEGARFYRIFFLIALFAWGTIATSVCFGDMHGRSTSMSFLLLPASALEKTLSRLSLHTVGLVVYLLVFTTALSWVAEGLNLVTFDVRRTFFSPFDSLVWFLMPYFICTQAMFFLGAAWFRKVHFVKTVGVTVAIVLGLCAFAVLVSGLLFGTMGWTNDDGDVLRAFDWVPDAASIAYFYVLPPLCWFVAWLRVTEMQVSHGI